MLVFAVSSRRAVRRGEQCNLRGGFWHATGQNRRPALHPGTNRPRVSRPIVTCVPCCRADRWFSRSRIRGPGGLLQCVPETIRRTASFPSKNQDGKISLAAPQGCGKQAPSATGRPSPPPSSPLVPRGSRRPLPQLRGRGRTPVTFAFLEKISWPPAALPFLCRPSASPALRGASPPSRRPTPSPRKIGSFGPAHRIGRIGMQSSARASSANKKQRALPRAARGRVRIQPMRSLQIFQFTPKTGTRGTLVMGCTPPSPLPVSE
jgi:hypothetical protein